MTERVRNSLIGLFVLGGLVSLAVLIVLFGEGRGMFSTGYIVIAKFDSVMGVRQGTDVNLAGVWVGKVNKVELIDESNPTAGARALMEINQNYLIDINSIANVYTPILGQPVINIEPPSMPSRPVAKDGTGWIPGVVKSPFDTVMDPQLINSLENATEQIGLLAASFNKLISRRTLAPGETPDAEGLAPNLYTAIVRLDAILKHFDTVLGDPEVQSNLKLTMANFREASENAKTAAATLGQLGEDARLAINDTREVVVKLDHTVENTNQQIENLGAKFALNLDKLSRFMDYLNVVGRDMAEGEGAIGMLLRDAKFYEELMLTVQRVGQVAGELKVLVIQWQREGLLSSFQ
ncbi:MAG: MCE family protein [Phycisphaerales bacterium]|nr:MCE family protein [Phycisphaerales bacterium]